MANYKVVIEGDEQDEVFRTYEDAEAYALYLVGCYHVGGEILEMSNMGDYPYDPDDEPEYEIIETDEEVEELSDEILLFREILHSPGIYDEDGVWEECPICGMGLHYYNGIKTCPNCESKK